VSGGHQRGDRGISIGTEQRDVGAALFQREIDGPLGPRVGADDREDGAGGTVQGDGRLSRAAVTQVEDEGGYVEEVLERGRVRKSGSGRPAGPHRCVGGSHGRTLARVVPPFMINRSPRRSSGHDQRRANRISSAADADSSPLIKETGHR
jgi:hypothetical protein